MDRSARTARRLPWPLLVVAVLLPSVQTVVSVHWQIVPVVTYPLLKGMMILLPLLAWRWMGLSLRDALAVGGVKRTTLLPGLVTGLLAAAGICGGYYAVIAGRLDPQPLAEKARALGLIEHYWLMAIGISLWNSLFEEYYWRMFVYDGLRRKLKSGWAVCAAGGVLFGLHHVFAMMSYFPPWWLGLFVLGTMLAGCVWTWMRLRGASIWDCYVSHVLADVAIMWIGWDMISRTL